MDQYYNANNYNESNSDTTVASLDRYPDDFATSPSPEQRRWLQQIIEDGPDINDDITRDETCKEYMSKFLNGTTDFKDTCQG